ncbi:MFS transporter [Streptomyces sp. NPDC004752]
MTATPPSTPHPAPGAPHHPAPGVGPAAGAGLLKQLARPPLGVLLALAFTARTTAAVLPVTLLLALADRYGYARAGLAAGSHTLLLAFLVPLRARLLDRCPHRHALPVMGACTLTFTTLAVLSVAARSPWWATLTLVITASISSPPLNAALRASWRRLAAGPTQLRAVHSADSVLEEAGFVIAPLTAGTAVLLLGPVHAYEAAAAGYLLVLTAFLTAARRYKLTPAHPPALPAGTRAARRARWWLGPLAQPRILAVLLPLLVMGCLFGGMSIYVPAAAQHQHTTTLIGPLLAATSAGGVAGGLLYSILPTHRLPLWTLYRLLTTAFALPACLLPLAGPLWLLGLLLLTSGLFVTPLFITAFLLIDTTATDDVRIEANTWVAASTDISNGLTAALIGALTSRHHFHTALTVLAACAATGLVTAAFTTTPAPPPGTAGAGEQAGRAGATTDAAGPQETRA